MTRVNRDWYRQTQIRNRGMVVDMVGMEGRVAEKLVDRKREVTNEVKRMVKREVKRMVKREMKR